MKKVMLMLGTRKGGFLAFSDLDRAGWELKGPYFKGAQLNHLNYVAGARPTVIAAVKSEWWGPDVRFSHDFGETWKEPARGIRFEEGRGHSVARVWVVEPDARPGREALYAGVDPGALFRSRDGGETWEEVRTLTEAPTRERWQPGAGGMTVHSIAFDPKNSDRMYVGVSAAGVFRSDDGGTSWAPKNKNVRCDFQPEKFPEVGQCVHHLEMHPSNPNILYQQNHCGVYRSENAGDDWIDLCEGLPSRFGFPLAVHPHDGDTIYVIPEESDENRVTAGAFRVFRSRNRGHSWEALTQGLPQTNAYENVMRSALTTDPLDRAGVYVGTQAGHLFASRDAGDHWSLLFANLPPIYSVKAALVEI